MPVLLQRRHRNDHRHVRRQRRHLRPSQVSEIHGTRSSRNLQPRQAARSAWERRHPGTDSINAPARNWPLRPALSPVAGGPGLEGVRADEGGKSFISGHPSVELALCRARWACGKERRGGGEERERGGGKGVNNGLIWIVPDLPARGIPAAGTPGRSWESAFTARPPSAAAGPGWEDSSVAYGPTRARTK